MATGDLLRTIQTRSDHWVVYLAFSPNGKTLAAEAPGNNIVLINVATGAVSQTLSGHFDLVYSVAFSPNGKLLASGSRDGYVILWDVETGQSIARNLLSANGGWVNSVAFSPDGKTLAAGGNNGLIVLWNVAP